MEEGIIRQTAQLSPGWVAVVFLLVLIVLAWVNMTSPRKWGLLAEATARARIPRQAFREEIDLQDRTFLGLLLAACMVIALFCLQLASISGLAMFNFLNYAGYFVASIVVVVALVWLIRITSWIFHGGQALHEYLYHTVLLLIVLGLALLPVSIFLAYSAVGQKLLVIIGCAVIGLMLSIRWMRAVVIGTSEGIAPQYILLYLCAAEILPIAMAISTFELSFAA